MTQNVRFLQKVCALLLCLTLVLTVLPLGVLAEAAYMNVTVTPSVTEAQVGDAIEYTITATGNDICCLEFTLEIPEGMTYVAGSACIPAGLKENLGWAAVDWTEMSMKWTGYNDIGVTFPEGTVLLTFSCTVDAVGQHEIDMIDVLPFDGSCEDVEPQVTIGKVTVVENPDPSDDGSTVTVYCQTPDTWGECWVYWWGDVDDLSWPGVKMTSLGNDIWYYEVPAGATNLIFNTGSGTQTADLEMPTVKNAIYVISDGNWTVYAGPAATVYYLFGYINGANHACEEDAANLGDYKFTNGKLTAIMAQDSYVGVKTADSGAWYMTDGSLGTEVTSAVLYDSDEMIWNDAEKLFVPGNCQVTFTLVENGDGTLTLSYEAVELPAYYVAGSMNGWNVKDEGYRMTVNADGIYSLTMSLGIGNYSLKVTDGTWDSSWGDNGDNLVFIVASEGEVTVTFDTTAQTVSVSADCLGTDMPLIINSIHLAGNEELTGYAWYPTQNQMNCEMGVYSITFTDVPAGTHEFKFVANGDWALNWGNGFELVSGQRYTAYVCAGNCRLVVGEDGSTVTISLDTVNMNLYTGEGATCMAVVEGPEEEQPVKPTISDYYIASSMNGWDPNADDYRMIPNGGDTYSLALWLTAGEHELKVTDGTWDNSWGENNSNYCLTLPQDGAVLVTFDANTGTVTATDEVQDGELFDYYPMTYDGNNYCTILGYWGTAAEVIIPSVIDGYIVSGIASGVFSDNAMLEKVVFPETLGHIEGHAFSDCPNLTYVGINSGFTGILDGVFENCTGLIEISLPESLERIGEIAFANCKNLTKVVIPKSVTMFEGNSFENCPNLTIYCYSGSAAHMALEGTSYSYVLLDEHEHSYTTTVETAATCTEAGSQIKNCTICEYSYSEAIDALGHNEVVDAAVAPTCTETGLTEGKHCDRCGEVIVAQTVVQAQGCSFGAYIYNNDATCDKDGTKTAECDRCGATDTVTDMGTALGHDWRDATCTTPKTCNRCGETEGEALGHDWKAATCTTPKTCNRCGETEGEALGHDWRAATCTDPKTCNRCGETEGEPLDHSYGSYLYNNDATCEDDGTKTAACSACGATDTVTAEGTALDHDWRDATCTDPKTCNRCGVTQGGPLGHSFGMYTYNNDASCEEDGTKTTICSACGETQTVTAVGTALGHDWKDATCTDSKICKRCYETEGEALGHGFGSYLYNNDATCENDGTKTAECERCGGTHTVTAEGTALGHSYSAKVTEPTCTTQGYTVYTCSVCTHFYKGDYVDAAGHTYGNWIVDVEATVLAEGSQHRDCTVCTHSETQIIERIEIDVDTNTDYGLAVFTVVHAQTLEPISGAQIFISTEKDGENTFITDADGKVSVVLPVAKQVVSAYAPGCLTRNLNVNIKAGVNEVPKIGLSDIPTYDAEITSELMTIEEIEAAGIDTSDPENKHVYRYELKLEFEAEIDVPSIVAYFNASGTFLGGFSSSSAPGGGGGSVGEPSYNLHYHVVTDGHWHSWCKNVEVDYGEEVLLTYRPWRDNDDYIFDGWYEDATFTKKIYSVDIEDYSTFVYGRWIYIGDEEEPKTSCGIRIPTKDDEVITVYPVSEYFYLIIRGEVTWLKEMFDVQMLVVNHSETDTLEDLTATLELPEGLSLAAMVGEEQTLVQKIDHVGEGESKAVHWYVRGDTAGSYDLKARLQGTIMPFEEPIDDVFVAEDQLQVWAGDAMHLHFEFPNAAYYGEDYPITITLTNVSDITLYNVNHMVQIEQGMKVYYSDGTKKERIEQSTWKSIGVREFHPGDKIIIETSVNIFFESEMIQAELEKLIGFVDKIEQILNGYKAVETGINAADKLINCISGCSKALDDFDFTSGTDEDKLELFKQLHAKISSLSLSYTTSGNKTIDASVRLANSGVDASLNAITNDPEQWLKDHSVKDIRKLLSNIETLENSIVSSADTSKKFDIFDSIRTAISAIPIRFVLKNVIMIEDENNTTSIPWSYSVSDASVQYFGVSNVSKYLMSIVQAGMGEYLEDNIPWYLQLIPGLDDPLNKEDAIKYIQATENEIAQFKAKDATGEVKFRAWVETNSTAAYSLRRTASAVETGSFILSCNNETAVYENGVLTFTGDGMISLTPQSQVGGTLYIEDSNGNLYTYVINVVEQHECFTGEKEIVIPPTADYDGFAVKCCQVCNDLMEIEMLSYDDRCSEHAFSDWNVGSAANCTNAVMSTRYCTVCGITEYQFVDAVGHICESWEITNQPSCSQAGEEKSTCSTCGQEITRPIDPIDHTEGQWEVTTPATSDSEGEKTLYCASCQAVIRTEAIPKIAKLAFCGASLTLYDNLSIRFKVRSSLITDNGYEEVYVVFRFGTKEVVVRDYTVSDGQYVFQFSNISPQRMQDTVYATLYATRDHVTYASATKDYSVATYCYNMLSDSKTANNPKLRTLLVDLLNYGAATQKYTNHNTGELVNQALTDTQKSWGTADLRALNSVQDASYKVVENPAATWKSAGLVLDQAVTIRVKLAAEDIEGMTVKVMGDRVNTITVSSEDFEATSGGYYVFIKGLNAAQMSETLYLTVYDDDTPVSNTLRYSIETYASKYYNSTVNCLGEVLTAMMKYADAAKVYIS